MCSRWGRTWCHKGGMETASTTWMGATSCPKKKTPKYAQKICLKNEVKRMRSIMGQSEEGASGVILTKNGHQVLDLSISLNHTFLLQFIITPIKNLLSAVKNHLLSLVPTRSPSSSSMSLNCLEPESLIPTSSIRLNCTMTVHVIKLQNQLLHNSKLPSV